MSVRTPAGLILGLLLLATTGLHAQEYVPSSHHSREAIARVQPELEEDLREIGCEVGSPIFIRIFKESSELEMWVEADSCFHLFRTYSICRFSGALGPKLRRGDMQAPEGFYYVTPSRMNPQSMHHLSFDIGYPNDYDSYHQRTGNDLMVHGRCASIGCYAMTNATIEEIYALADAALRNGQPFFRVHAFPFRMTEKAMEHHSGMGWDEFWANLREGYLLFEETCRPPNVLLQEDRYVFGPS